MNPGKGLSSEQDISLANNKNLLNEDENNFKNNDMIKLYKTRM